MAGAQLVSMLTQHTLHTSASDKMFVIESLLNHTSPRFGKSLIMWESWCTSFVSACNVWSLQWMFANMFALWKTDMVDWESRSIQLRSLLFSVACANIKPYCVRVVPVVLIVLGIHKNNVCSHGIHSRRCQAAPHLFQQWKQQHTVHMLHNHLQHAQRSWCLSLPILRHLHLLLGSLVVVSLPVGWMVNHRAPAWLPLRPCSSDIHPWLSQIDSIDLPPGFHTWLVLLHISSAWQMFLQWLSLTSVRQLV